MKSVSWMLGTLLAFCLATTGVALAQDYGKGHGKGHDKHDDDDDQSEHYYKDHDREAMRGWYGEHEGHLPPGLAKRDQLPPDMSFC
jgi:hypothetical protein